MTDRYNDNNSGNIAFDPNSQGQVPTQGQEQGQCTRRSRVSLNANSNSVFLF